MGIRLSKRSCFRRAGNLCTSATQIDCRPQTKQVSIGHLVAPVCALVPPLRILPHSLPIKKHHPNGWCSFLCLYYNKQYLARNLCIQMRPIKSRYQSKSVEFLSINFQKYPPACGLVPRRTEEIFPLLIFICLDASAVDSKIRSTFFVSRSII